jgi:hydroxymethylglutaryl-CoA synthase
MVKQVGIDTIAVHVPRLFVDLDGEWAQVRASELGEPSVEAFVGKVTNGVGVRRMAVPDAHEDSATMAAMAAIKAIAAAGIDPRDIDYLAVGTETTVDQSKSIAVYVLGMLERFYGVALPEVSTPQIQFACIGATYALEAAVNRIRAGENRKPYALVIGTDVSRYPLRSPGEYTQGAGAVAMLIREQPRLLIFEPGLMSAVSRDERDFFRPNWSSTAVVDGKYSIGVYLSCIEAAWKGWLDRYVAASNEDHPHRPDHLLDYLLFHVPFPRMAEYAAARILGDCWRGAAAQDQELVASLPASAGITDAGAANERMAWDRQLAKTALFRQTFAQKVEPSLHFGRNVGNIYSGALYGALASLFDWANVTGTDLARRRLGFFSYGSGASAAVWTGIVAPTYQDVPINLRAELATDAEGGRRIPLGLAEYERLHTRGETELDIEPSVQAKLQRGEPLSAADTQHLATVLDTNRVRIQQPGPSVVPPCNEFALIRLGTDHGPHITDWGYRYYGWVADEVRS